MAADMLVALIGWVHISAVIFWLGGAIYFEFILSPSLSSVSPEESKKLVQGIAKRFPPLAWGAIVIVGITGILRIVVEGAGNMIDILLDFSGYGLTLLIKLLVFAGGIFVGVNQTRTAMRLETASSREAALEIQKRLSLLSRVSILLGIVVIFLSVVLRLGGF